MGFFNRLTDFGDREQVRTYAMRIGVGLNQIANTTSPQEIKGLSIAIKQDVQTMMMWASKLSQESINCLDVNVNGRKIPFRQFLYNLTQISTEIVNKGGFSII
ncbi:MAG: hypothetical protein J6K33_10420 [Alistipes sp.]|nr:hypothetical protein [Alistipes sp.]